MKNLLLSAVCSLFAFTTFAQDQNIVKDKCLRPGLHMVADDAAPAAGIREFQPWTIIKYEDIIYKKRSYRSIDVRSNNELLTESALGASLAGVLLEGAVKGEYKLYGSSRLMSVFTQEEVAALKTAGELANVTGYQIKEDSMQLSGERGRFVRIIALGPVVEGREQPLFWVFYPELRKYLYSYKISDPAGVVEDLDELFEGRFFESKLIPREVWDQTLKTAK